MTTKHTPGPWEIDYNDSSNPIIGADKQVVARVAHLAAWRHPLEAEANARLIAAAPELLDLAKSALEELGKMDFTLSANWNGSIKTNVALFLEKAIAKAEGRE